MELVWTSCVCQTITSFAPALHHPHCHPHCHKTDLQAITDDMLIRLAPKFGVTLPAELQQLQQEQQQQQQKEQSSTSSSSKAASSSSSGKATTVFFPGDFKP